MGKQTEAQTIEKATMKIEPELVKEVLGNAPLITFAKRESADGIMKSEKILSFCESLNIKPTNSTIGIMSSNLEAALLTNAKLNVKKHAVINADMIRKASLILATSGDDVSLVVSDKPDTPAFLVAGTNVMILAPRIERNG
jgi:hypothetical protein